MKLLALAPLLLLLGCSAEVSQPTIGPDEREVGTGAIVQVQCLEGTGTAVHIGNGKYASARHVVSMFMCTVNGEPVKDVKLSDEDKDFGTFSGPRLPVKMKYSCSGYKAGKDYLAIGHAFGLPRLTANPWIASPFRIGWQHAFVGEAIPGMSGGPVVDEKGILIGVVNMRWPARSIALRDTELCS